MLSIRGMTHADIPFGMMLKEQAGWNQRAADWERTLRLQPDGGFVAEWSGRPAGTVMVCLFDEVAWISMMLVEASLRGRGIGRGLMEQALAFAEAHGARSIRLDATPLGEPLYRRLGFEADFALARWGGRPRGGDGSALVPRTLTEVAAWDRAITGTNRYRLLELLLAETPAWGCPDLPGYVSFRRGSVAVQIGPCLSESSRGGCLLEQALGRLAGDEVVVDIPVAHSAAGAIAAQCGLTPRRTLLRMTRGSKVAERVEHLWASFGPEKG